MDLEEILSERNIVVTKEMKVSDPWFKHIKEGRTKLEGRKLSPTWSTLVVGDVLLVIRDKGNRFVSLPPRPSRAPRVAESYDWFLAVITGISKYPAREPINNNDYGPLDDMLIFEGIKPMLPGANNLQEARNVYLSYSSLDEIIQYGMQAIRLQVLDLDID